MEKTCHTCQQALPLDQFNKNGKAKDGKDSSCRQCRLLYRLAWRKKHPERDRESVVRWKTKNPKKYEECWRSHNKQRRLRVLQSVCSDLRCVRCGCDRIELLEINHKNGGGLKEVGRKSQVFYGKILSGERSTEDLEILCKVCNIWHYAELKFGRLPYKVTWEKSNVEGAAIC